VSLLLTGSAVLWDGGDGGAVIDRRFRETYRHGCFAEFLAAREDYEARLNHEGVVGRASEGTLRAVETSRGLSVEFVLHRKSMDTDDLLRVLSDTRGFSIGLIAREEELLKDPGHHNIRHIKRAGLSEISIVLAPSAPALLTTCTIREISDVEADLRRLVNRGEFAARRDLLHRKRQIAIAKHESDPDPFFDIRARALLIEPSAPLEAAI
jgi:phage head maturation protease